MKGIQEFLVPPYKVVAPDACRLLQAAEASKARGKVEEVQLRQGAASPSLPSPARPPLLRLAPHATDSPGKTIPCAHLCRLSLRTLARKSRPIPAVLRSRPSASLFRNVRSLMLSYFNAKDWAMERERVEKDWWGEAVWAVVSPS